MRKILIVFLIGVVAISSCNKTGDDGNLEVKFTCSLVETRVSGADGTVWDANDPVGIYMIKATPGTLASANVLADNRQYVASAGTLTSFSLFSGMAVFYPSDGSDVKFIAYYPYSSAVTTNYEVPVSLSDQSNQSDIDLLYAPVTGNYNKTNSVPVPLVFSHKLVKLVFAITNDVSVTEPVANGVTVRIPGQQTVGVFDLTDGTVTPSGAVSSITVQSAGTGATVKAEAIVFPGTPSIEFIFTNNIGEIFTMLITTPSWVAGNSYTYTVTLKK